MPRKTTWTADELTAEVSRRLAGSIEAGELPIEPAVSLRTLRYYRRLGLISAPVRRVRRRWLFEERHVLELMAIRRLQTAGWDLVQIGDALEVTREREEILKALADPRDAEIPEGLLRELDRLVGAKEQLRHF